MEAVIAIGIIVGGLVGVAALVPVAARNAQATMELDRGAGESVSAAVEGKVRSFLDLESLVIWDKRVFGSAYVMGGAYAPTDYLQSIQWKLTGQGDNHPPVGIAPLTDPPVIAIGKLESPGYDHMPLGSGLSAGICIDPLGMPDPNLANQYIYDATANAPAQYFHGVDNTDSAFDPSRFPYFSERYNPLAVPNAQIGNQPASPNWPMAPRMWRATLKTPAYVDSPAPARTHQLLSAPAARGIFRTSGSIASISGGDERPSSVFVSQTNIGGAFVDGARDTSTDYSWFVTLTPSILGGDKFRQSIVVVRQRLAPVPRRLADPLALQKQNYTIEEPDENPSAERLTWIDPTSAVGFSGGVGGDVTVYGSQAVSDEIAQGQWVMLSRQPHYELLPVGSGNWAPDGPAVHRWFRVLRVNEPETDDAFTMPGDQNGPYAVWRRRITLAGPDWLFEDGALDAGGNPVPADDTFCTIVDGVVSVVESEVDLQ